MQVCMISKVWLKFTFSLFLFDTIATMCHFFSVIAVTKIRSIEIKFKLDLKIDFLFAF